MGDVLGVTVCQLLYIDQVTKGALHLVFDPYGAMEEVHVVEMAARVKALVSFRSWHDAAQAREAFHGRCIWDNYCWMNIQNVQPIPIGSTTETPAMCSKSTSWPRCPRPDGHVHPNCSFSHADHLHGRGQGLKSRFRMTSRLASGNGNWPVTRISGGNSDEIRKNLIKNQSNFKI